MRRLARVALVGVASPGYLAEHGTPHKGGDLTGHRCLLGLDDAGAPVTHWRVGGKQRAVGAVAHSNDPHLVLRWALRGLGIAVLPATLVAAPIARGELVSVMPTELRTEGTIALVILERRLVSPAVRAFVAFVGKRGPAALGSVSAAR